MKYIRWYSILVWVLLIIAIGCHNHDHHEDDPPLIVPIDSTGKNVVTPDTLFSVKTDSAIADSSTTDVSFKTYFNFYYDLNDPDATYKLPNQLEEVSGLSFLKEGELVCIEDEHGRIYIYDYEKGRIDRDYKFEGNGDYEGVEVVGNTAYVLKSSGDIYIVKHFEDNDEREVKKNENFLSKKNDVEGLGYDPITQSLLVACKGDPFADHPNHEYKTIYRFDLEKEELIKDPYYVISKEDIRAQFPDETYYSKFEPSAIAVHPLTFDVYILSYVTHKLLVLDHDGGIKYATELDSRLLAQPEGMCFSPEGDLYISSEGQDNRARILKFRPKDQPVITREILSTN